MNRLTQTLKDTLLVCQQLSRWHWKMVHIMR